MEQVLAADWQMVIIGTGVVGTAWLELLRQVRQASDAPVVLIGAEMAAGLEAGADVCLPRNSTIPQLLACLRAISRRATLVADAQRQRMVSEEFTIADLRIVPESRRAILAGRELSLTPGQFDLLMSLARASGRIKSRDDLCAEVNARELQALGRSVDVQIGCLRKKLGEDPRRPRFIRTVRSAGYALVCPDGS